MYSNKDSGMKRYLYILIFAMMPIMLLAQAAGGTIKRPKTSKKKVLHNYSAKESPIENEQTSFVQRLMDNMIFVEGGTFMMGKTQDQNVIFSKEDRTPVHQVTLNSFYISKYEVTQEEWELIMGNNPSLHKGKRRPVEMVSWEDCQIFLDKLNKLSGRRFRLPSEEEWEYAARGGQYGKGFKYAGSNNCNEVGWNNNNSDMTSSDVGMKLPNELGLYDMSGNVLEWCQNWYGNYSVDPQSNQNGNEKGEKKVCRGGCFIYGESQCLVSCRNNGNPASTAHYIGLRLAL